jgi:hypothetical protein
MKNALAQIHQQLIKIEPRFIQLAFTAFALAVMIINQSPIEGPGGTR